MPGSLLLADSAERAVEKPQFVDTHHHLWDLEHHRYDWLVGDGSPSETALLGPYRAIRRDYLIGDLLADFAHANVIKSVHVEAEWNGDPVDETRWLQGIAQKFGYPHGIIASADLRSPTADRQLERHVESPNMRGIRTPFSGKALSDPNFNRGLSQLDRLNLVWELQISDDLMPAALRIAERYPSLRIVLEHTGLPMRRGSDYFEVWRRALAEVARADNVVIKISGLGMTDHAWTVMTLRPWILAAIDAFGVDRVVLGTNWPVDSLYSSYGVLVDAYWTIIGDFRLDEREALFSKNAISLYRL
jgi:predicted TIM-barrel fold metal-dependent hydrolase